MIIFLLRSGLRSTHYDVATHRPASDNYWILVDCTQTDLNHHQFVLPLNYVCIQWIGGFNPNPLGGKNYAYILGATQSTRSMPAE